MLLTKRMFQNHEAFSVSINTISSSSFNGEKCVLILCAWKVAFLKGRLYFAGSGYEYKNLYISLSLKYSCTYMGTYAIHTDTNYYYMQTNRIITGFHLSSHFW